MSLGTRLGAVEASTWDTLLWHEVSRLAAEHDLPPEDIFGAARDIIDRYGHLAETRPSGRLNLKPVLRAMADAEGLDYAVLTDAVKRSRLRPRAGKGVAG